MDFTQSVEQLELREKIPLLDLPWGDGKDWMVVDLWEDYDEDLLDAFYNKYMITQFGTSDELEPIENWHKAMSDEGRDDPNICDLHVLLALGLPGEHKGKGHKYIIGGLVFEYYPETNNALVTYLVVNQKWSGKGIGTDLILRTLTILDQNAKQKGHIAGCNAIFLEVMFSPHSDITGAPDSSLSHVFLFNKGFRSPVLSPQSINSFGLGSSLGVAPLSPALGSVLHNSQLIPKNNTLGQSLDPNLLSTSKGDK
ncbi:hypothetical protein PPL_11816 [Heterostelium album PN500]|uniref:N-acetyltransferase domain-containing protein n=1 Tax=Heterostelium pallidum (strain ATCC 26659 / Pp 5 / PN500) TaxID=670386 RepID=D3BUJ5_HETP5|nr:hypothetical protein PPL_11816 [Heterostelium album PN500]EFA74783.1 hypothetical protein PPL_11816 [Heterostelium album PN500]|eukprot:XP_020426917.1 hypothetical protein PPL_11816 [Heterostelium album PN500]